MKYFDQKLRFECLETRHMLSGLGFGAGVIAKMPNFGDSGVVGKYNPFGAFRAQATVLSATISDPANVDLGGSVQYFSAIRNGVISTKLTIDARGVYPGDPDVGLLVNGVEVLEAPANFQGEIHVTFSSNPTGDELPLPADFPKLAAGDTVGINTAMGTLSRGAVPTSQLRANITDPNNGSFQGRVNYSFETINGEMQQTLSVQISGAAANSKLAVLLGQRAIASLKTDADGDGMIVLSSAAGTLPAGFPVILAAGGYINIGTAYGVLTDVPRYGLVCGQL